MEPTQSTNECLDLGRRIKRANREVYNAKSAPDYNRNESIFNPTRERACRQILANAAAASGNCRYIDVGTGSGHLLRLSQDYFQNGYGVDISENMLAQIRVELPRCHLAAADAEALPFPTGFFNCVSCYALLHHLYDHRPLFQECYRVLAPGGTLYTDHDPNYFFTRFYRLYYRLKHRHRPGFGTELEELAEYHNTTTSGINPERLKQQLLSLGFKKVTVQYRSTDRGDCSGVAGIALGGLRLLARCCPLRTFFTHFAIIAVK